jgi:hypothetical protein
VNDGFSAFKAMGFGVAIIFAGMAVAPNVAGGQFDLLKISKGKGKGRSTLPEPEPAPEEPSTGGGTTTTPESPTTTTNGFYSEETIINSNFDIGTELINVGLPASAAPDVVGAFRFVCNAGQVLRDDPVVYPGQPGKSHVHQFFGNTGANAYSTYQSLRTSGQSTCMSPLNRSAYWMPAMLDGKGNVVRPDHMTVYYKRRPISDPKCSLSSGDVRAEGNCVPLPNGLRFVFGYDMITGKSPTGFVYFNCAGPTASPGHYSDLTTALANCPAGEGNRVGAVIKAPACWDGKNLDSPNHRDHVAYHVRDPNTGINACPADHSYVIPTFTLQAWWHVGAEDDAKLWSLSSDSMRPDLPKGSTFHADWFGAWDNTIMGMWMDNCINKMLNCSDGDLGNGKKMKQFSGFSWTASPRLVPIPG